MKKKTWMSNFFFHKPAERHINAKTGEVFINFTPKDRFNYGMRTKGRSNAISTKQRGLMKDMAC